MHLRLTSAADRKTAPTIDPSKLGPAAGTSEREQLKRLGILSMAEATTLVLLVASLCRLSIFWVGR